MMNILPYSEDSFVKMKRIVAAVLLLLVSFMISCGVEVPSSMELLILMYHHINDTGDAGVTISEVTFEKHLELLHAEGWVTVSPAELVAYVDHGEALPDKPVLIVFDDGYESNYSLALPLLQKHDVKATICPIGWCVERDTYKETDQPIIPHFSWEQARAMVETGLVTIGSHSYDMHMSAAYESGLVRESASQLPDETVEDFMAAFRADHQTMSELIKENLGYTPMIFAYPHGRWDANAEAILKESDVRITLITDEGRNTLHRGDPESLYLLKRYNVNEFTDLNSILNPPVIEE